MMSIIEKFVESNSLIDQRQKEITDTQMVALVVGLLVTVLLNALIGQYLWNNVVTKLFSGANKARWYDTLALQLMLALVMPQRM